MNKWVSYERGLNTRIEYVTGNGEHRVYQSQLLPHKTIKGDYWIVLIILFILGILVLYTTLRFCITHIFGLNLLHDPRFETPKLAPGGKEKYFIVGLPCSGKRKLVELISKGIAKDKVLHIDLNEGTFIRPGESYELIVARNFHIGLNDHESNEKKLELIESFKNQEGVAVIIVSNVDPSAILEFYNKVARYYRNDKKDYELDGNYRTCRQAFRKWKQVLGNYSIHYHALKKEKLFADNKFISHELDHGDYLPKLKEQLNESILNRREREEMILKVENLSHFYYTLIWNCLTSSEKFLLHDLAKDGFVNMRNMKTIRALRQKGILTCKEFSADHEQEL